MSDDSWEQTRLFMRRPWLDGLPDGPALPEGYTLRPYQATDLTVLARLLDRAFADMPWDEARVRRTLRDDPTVEATYVIAHGNALLATASARVMPRDYPGSGYVHWVAADPDVQGQGFGTLINLRVLRHFREAGLRDAVLETGSERAAAVRSYLRLGFVPEYHYDDPGEQRRWARLLSHLVR